MKKFKYLPFYFLCAFCLCIIFQRFVFMVHGLPMGGYSWSQIWKKMPLYIIISSAAAVYFNSAMNGIENKKNADAIIAKNRIAERKKYYSAPNTHECRICGYYSDNFPWGEDGESPSFQLCPCCGVQFGKEDCTLASIKEYRAEWISKGGKWYDKNEKPEGWDMESQMKKIPDEFI